MSSHAQDLGKLAGKIPIIPTASGGTGTATPALVAGTNITIAGTWPNQTITATIAVTDSISPFMLMGA